MEACPDPREGRNARRNPLPKPSTTHGRRRTTHAQHEWWCPNPASCTATRIEPAPFPSGRVTSDLGRQATPMRTRMSNFSVGIRSRQTPTRCNPDTRCPPTKKEARCTRDGDKRFGSGRSHVSPSLGEEDAPSRTLEYAPLGASPLGNALGSAHRRATKAQRSFARLESIVPRIFLDGLDR
eukprot:scaffold840_cov344-Pavlova_lutheri.AAC.123